MIAITIDVDWAPDKIMDSVMSAIEPSGVPVTLFCTDFTADRSGESSSLERHRSRHELGVHPNFQNTGDYEAVWDSVLRHYPYATGFRSHNGCSGWPIAVGGARRGIRYEVYCTVYPVYVPPFKINRDVLEYYVFTNSFFDSQMLTVKDFDWSFRSMWFAKELAEPNKIFVLSFHPNVLYYDMVTAEEYERRMPTYHSVDEEHSFLTKPLNGAMKFLRQLLETFPMHVFTTPSDFGRNHGLWSSANQVNVVQAKSGPQRESPGSHPGDVAQYVEL